MKQIKYGELSIGITSDGEIIETDLLIEDIPHITLLVIQLEIEGHLKIYPRIQRRMHKASLGKKLENGRQEVTIETLRVGVLR